MGFESNEEITPEAALRAVRKVIEEIDEDYSAEEADNVLRRLVEPQEGLSNLPEASDAFIKRLEKLNIPRDLATAAIADLYEERLAN